MVADGHGYCALLRPATNNLVAPVFKFEHSKLLPNELQQSGLGKGGQEDTTGSERFNTPACHSD